MPALGLVHRLLAGGLAAGADGRGGGLGPAVRSVRLEALVELRRERERLALGEGREQATQEDDRPGPAGDDDPAPPARNPDL